MTSQAWRHPRSAVLLALALGCSLLLFARSPGTGFVYDEQEAILANPYLRGQAPWSDAFRLDFWGLPAPRTIGSYRPLPNLVWRALSFSLRFDTPFCLQLLGPLLHAVVAFLLYVLLRRHALGAPDLATATGRQRANGALDPALAGAGCFLVLGVVSEAVVAVVGQADLWVAVFTLLGLLALGLPLGARELALFGSGLLGLLSKETMLGSLPLFCFGAVLLAAPAVSRRRRALGFLGALVASCAAVLVLVFLRRHFFLGSVEPALPRLAVPDSGLAWALRLFEQPRLPIDPQNNPLATAPVTLRAPTAAGIYASNLLQMFLPLELRADYSFPREVPHGWTLRAVTGALLLILPLVWGLARTLRAFASTRADSDEPGHSTRSLLTLAMLWLPLTYLPVSNALVLLPTIRAERLLYVPALGLAVAFAALWPHVMRRAVAQQLLVLWMLTSSVQARAHALHYESDVVFWRATARGTPGSAKAHLNLGVMLGARGDAAGRIAATQESVRLAPKWPMAHVYLGDALCRAGRAREAIPHYVRGLELSPDQKDISALALQCLWEARSLDAARSELERAAEGDPRGWLAYLLHEVVEHGDENGGVPAEYRPRGYNQRSGALRASATGSARESAAPGR